ncbi:ABC transporter ATP-binding protein [Mycoplasma parvum]|uniref:ABC transporter domain-containing protein n=1 Tax=Mycoplasma parvum str. Indiana TaxID=1403316 RepID=U5NCN3_9MOLU|nr:ABC transporter ATP-binding protein [Mycoplasma parvum]AGX89187.1 hypothetical protein PRV_02245 [Mycoplasma parvum str. Indiana]
MKFKVLSIISSLCTSFLPLTIFSGKKIMENYKIMAEDEFLQNNGQNLATKNNSLPQHSYWSMIMASGGFSWLKKLLYQLDFNKTSGNKGIVELKGLLNSSESLYSKDLHKLLNKFLTDLDWKHLISPTEHEDQKSDKELKQENLVSNFDSFSTKFLTLSNWIDFSIFSVVILFCSSFFLFGWIIFIALDPNISKSRKIKRISYHIITQLPGWFLFYYLDKKRKINKFDLPFYLKRRKESKDHQISSFELSNVNYQLNNYQILKNISCNLEKNEFYSIIGPNGAGKTTFLKHLGGILKSNSGELYLGGKELKNIDIKYFWKKTAYIPQELNIQADTPVYDFLLYSRYSSISRLEKISDLDHIKTLEVIKSVGIQELRWKRMGELSGGQRQKVILASILMKDAELILMDEPTTFLDVHNRNFFISFLKKLHLSGKTIIANLHNFTEIANLSTRIVALKDGKIFKMGDKVEILKADILNQLYDLNLSSENWNSLLYSTSSNY